MIKNWKLFLESDEPEDIEGEIRSQGEELKRGLNLAFAPMYIGEMTLRFAKNSNDPEIKAELKRGVDMIFDIIFNTFVDIVEKKDLEPELQEIMISYLERSLESARETMINQNFKAGIAHMVEVFVQFIIDYKKASDNEGEEWKQEKEKDYSEMSKSEINSLIDQALDARDFEKVRMLSKYIKESKSFSTDEIKSACEKVAELLANFVQISLKV
jgi:hypothetical protein